LGDYLKNDLKEGRITLKRAREIMASFFIKGTEWIQSNTPVGTGDAQHYQNIVLAGLDKNGVEVTNEVTYLVLDIVEELGISDFPITVRVNEKTPERLLTKVAKVMRHGGGVVAVYNEPLILKSLVKYGYDEVEALDFANDGCWEVQVPGKTRFVYLPFDSLAILQKVTLNGYEEKDFADFEQLYSAYLADLKEQLVRIYAQEVRSSGWAREDENTEPPCSVISLFEKGCIENARSYHEGGPIYNVRSPHLGGIADTVNSLYAIKKLVFDDKKVLFSELNEALKSDWQADSKLCALALEYSYYGTDNDEVDEIYKRLLHDYYLICNELNKSPVFSFFPGVSTFGREIEWRTNRLATPFGRKSGTILSGNASPTPGTDTEGATAVIKSYTKADLSEMVTGTALDIKLMPSTFSGKSGISAIKSLIKAFVSLGGYFMQIDSVSVETLKKARENPQEYKTLSVRVSGWSARFVTLTKEWQDMIIQRMEHEE
jgi:formate C-acetyltransferase